MSPSRILCPAGPIWTVFRPVFSAAFLLARKKRLWRPPRGRPGPGGRVPGIAIATMSGRCSPGLQKRQLRPSSASLYIFGMKGCSRAVQGGQGWALRAMSRGHRHGLWPLLVSARRGPHRYVFRLIEGAKEKETEGKGCLQRKLRGRGAAFGEHPQR